MLDLRKFYIGGQWVTPASSDDFPVLNPATEAQIGVITLANDNDVEVAVAAAKVAFETGARACKQERVARLERLATATEARLEDLAQAMMMEMGAPITMARAAQADAAIGHLHGFLDSLREQLERETLGNGDVLIREPIGVCGLITPWNWPINQIALKVIPALAVGATCV